MTTEKKTLYEEAIGLLGRINEEMKSHKQLDIINVKMVGVVNELNSVRVAQITGKDEIDNENK